MGAPLKILFLTRRNPDAARDGDIMSLAQTIQALESFNVRGVVSNDPAIDMAPFDVVHIYNLDVTAVALHYFVRARRQNKRVVVTPLYWRKQYWGEMQERNAPERPHFDPATMPVHAPARRALVHWLDEQAERATTRLLLDVSEWVFPKSNTEGTFLTDDFNTPAEKMRVARNGIDEQFAHGSAERFVARFGLRDFVLCVARLDYQKNIPNLVRAWRDEPIPLVLIGSRPDAEYFAECRAAAGENVHFLEAMPPPALADAYAAAKVHVLASWWEQAARSPMEAGMAGCNLVLTENCPAREYFGDECYLCDPGDLLSIRDAVRAAYAAPRQNHFAARLRQNCSWEHTAQVYARAYDELLARTPPPPNGIIRRMATADCGLAR